VSFGNTVWYLLNMKTLVFLASLIALVGCNATVGGVSSWDRAANGSCYDIQVVNRPLSEPQVCPNRDHFAPSDVQSSVHRDSTGGPTVNYICVCTR
jgi:hypothetical protein